VVQAVEDLGERRNSYAAAAKGVIAAVAVEAIAGVEALELGERHFFNRAGAVGRAVDGVVVDDDDLAVARRGRVELDDVGAVGDGPLEGSHGVFRRGAGGAPVADNARLRPGKEFEIFLQGRSQHDGRSGRLRPAFSPIRLREIAARGLSFGYLSA